MNKLLFDEYKKLSEIERERLKGQLKNSSTSLKLIAFLDKCTNRNFKNPEVVNFIYKNDTSIEYSILQNRYFKLRKKFTEEHLQTTNNSELLYTPQELEFYKAINYLKKEPNGAHKILIELESWLWNNNIFELLPKVIDQIIYCNQILNNLEENKLLYEKYDEAVRLSNDLYQALSLVRKIYEINHIKGVIHAQKELELLKRIATKNKAYPRFSLCYHFISLYYKLGSNDYVDQANITSRHFSNVMALTKKHPEIPTHHFKLNYLSIQNRHLNEIKTFYHHTRCEFEEAYQVMKEIWKTVNSDSRNAHFINTTHFINMVQACVASNRANEALEVTQELLTFFTTNKQQEKMNIAYWQILSIYTHFYPKIKIKNLNYYKSKMSLFVKHLRQKKETNTLTYVLRMKLGLASIEGSYEEAKKTLAEKELEEYYKTYNVYGIVEGFINTLLRENVKREEIENLKSNIDKNLFKLKDPSVIVHIRWMSRILCLKYP